MFSKSAIKKNHRGFSLMELAIVLSTMGLLLGGVWVVMNMIQSKQNIEQAKQDVWTVVRNIQTYYAGQGAMVAPTFSATANPTYIPARLVSSGCTTAPCLMTPWGYTTGSSGVNMEIAAASPPSTSGANFTALTGTSGGQYFQITYNLPANNKTACIQFVIAVTGSGGPQGLVEVKMNSTTTSIPVKAQGAITNCSPTARNQIFLTYLLRPRPAGE